jgi:hypothetical protein
MNEKDIYAELGKLDLQRERIQRHLMLLDQKRNDLKIELMKASKDANDTHNAEPVGSASGERDD